MDINSFEEKLERHQTKVSNTLKAMATKITAKVQDLTKELSKVKENVERIENKDDKPCNCNGANEDLRTDMKSIEARINALEETVTAESSELGRHNKNYSNQIQILKEKSNNNQQEIESINEKLRKLEEDHMQLMETSFHKKWKTVAEVSTINDELNKCIPNCEMNTREPIEIQISERNFSQTIKCRLCNNSYNKYAYLKAHMKTAHPCQFNCNYCDKKFSYRFDLKEHLE